MKSSVSLHRSLIAMAVGAVLALGAVSQVNAQSFSERRAQREAERARKKGGEAADVQFPAAKRESPKTEASAKIGPRLQKMAEQFNDGNMAEADAIAADILANPKANAYEKSFAAQIAGQVKYEADDFDAAIGYFRQALEFNGLDNNGHFGVMRMIGQLQLQDEKYADALASLDKFLAESGSQNPDDIALRATALYYLERYPETIAAIKPLVDASPAPKDNWLQLLMSSYFETENGPQAVAIAEKIAAGKPGDKRAQLNLSAAYQQADQFDKAAALLEKLRAAGQLTEDKEYRQLYSVYLNLDGKERAAADVINDGLQKGILKGDYQTYLALAQAYYFSDQAVPAIDAYRKAAPLAPNGETYLNLARLLWQEDRIPEAKEAARQAQAKGVKNPADIKKILALPSK